MDARMRKKLEKGARRILESIGVVVAYFGIVAALVYSALRISGVRW